jgi:ACS family hexuronate transporter-like MFS transporter
MSVKIGTYRWRIVVLLFFATTINYLDRQVLGILAPQVQTQFGWSESDYGFIIMAFQAAYAIGLLSMGALLDKIGTRLGFIISVSLLSLAGMFHAAVSSVAAFATARFALGIGASTNFPAAIKTIAEWFPKKERALATGLFNSGSNVGAILTPLIIPIVAVKFGWQWAFISAGALGFVWLVFWVVTYRKPEESKKLSTVELKFILQDEKDEAQKLPWKSIISYKQTWGICLARFLTDPIWWFFLFWLPKYLNSTYNIDLLHIGLPLIVVYVVSIVGSVFGGWFSSYLIKRGKNTVSARKFAIFMMALLVVPIFFTSQVSNLWIAVIFVSLATFAHQGYAANIFTIVSDIYPKNAVGSVTGLAGFAGAVGGVLFSGGVGHILEITESYYVIFGVASVAYLLCWLSLQLLVPNQKIQIE